MITPKMERNSDFQRLLYMGASSKTSVKPANRVIPEPLIVMPAPLIVIPAQAGIQMRVNLCKTLGFPPLGGGNVRRTKGAVAA